MNSIPIPVLVGIAMIIIGVAVGIYVAVQAAGRSRQDREVFK